MNGIKLDLKLNGPNLLIKTMFELLGFAVGMGMLLLISRLDADPVYVGAGTLMALALNILMTFILSVSMSTQFTLALSMGRTRREFLAAYALRCLLGQLLAYLILRLGAQAELAVYRAVLPGFDNRLHVERFLTNGWFFSGVVFGLTLVEMLCGLLYGSFGRPVFTVLYFAVVGCCLVVPGLFNEEGFAGKALARAAAWGSGIPPAVWAGLLAAAVAAVVAGIFLLGKKQMVK